MKIARQFGIFTKNRTTSSLRDELEIGMLSYFSIEWFTTELILDIITFVTSFPKGGRRR
ncbi:hypothetical protein B4113_3846 [Geobacillus sp. B4113_201601]|nr:hypothetical protein B4113_3846 [Geobacillus sp. B4113_201601]